MERIQAEVDQRCMMHQYYAGICDCNNEKETQDDNEDNKEDEDEDEEDEEDLNDDEKVEIDDTGSNNQKAVVERNEEDPERKNSKVCTML